MKASSQEAGPTQLEWEVHESKMRKLRAQKAKETKRRRYKETSEWVNPLGGKLFHLVPREDVALSRKKE